MRCASSSTSLLYLATFITNSLYTVVIIRLARYCH
nr:MAG TPA: hypothetical protein [Caudoviricetes sp.]